ncbi:hypothetical protein NBT05_06420 [Aquimarina sp. ERC-38]|uniref:hypothetical protein n=1 Tax=Aquimarina sp. ERC-38 TaxID=2949996 RepID=UPI002247E5E6|nr:hypothetical protein [Aquimarina sp. ERC-38]UZO82103.1 hypothetical protein NBT05_06420 [Aquimarina sp. ERC-38]
METSKNKTELLKLKKIKVAKLDASQKASLNGGNCSNGLEDVSRAGDCPYNS